MTLKPLVSAWSLVKQTVAAWSDDKAPSMGAALAYYSLFSIAPLLVIVISLTSAVFGEEVARRDVFAQLEDLMGPANAEAVQSLLEGAGRPSQGLVAAAVGFVVLLIGATTVFAELQSALDRIWRAPERPSSSGAWTLLRTRLLSFGLILGIGFLLMVSLIASAALSAFSAWWQPMLGGWQVLAGLLDFALSFGVITVAFAMIYKFMPSVRIEWRDVWTGATVTALMFTLGKLLIGAYIGRSGVATQFGAAASVAVLLVWVYYAAQVFLMGAEFTRVYAHTHGSRSGAAQDASSAALLAGTAGTPVATSVSRAQPAARPGPNPPRHIARKGSP